MAERRVSPQAEVAIGLIKSHPEAEVSAAYLEDRMALQRWEIVRLLKELQEAGRGTFITGRHGRETRFAKPAELRENPAATPMNHEGPTGNHIVTLARAVPTQVVIPADLTRAEADRLVRFINAIPDQ